MFQHSTQQAGLLCWLPLTFVALVSAAQAAPAAPASCRAHSGDAAPTVVELYTSEGCSSCPPADRWLSSLKPQADVLALSFHVNYWDRLGWPDRFATSAITQRQHQLPANVASNQVYTPQVVVNGGDWRRWPKLPAAGKADTGLPRLQLSRDGAQTVVLEVAADAGRSGQFAGQFAGYWAVLEDGHQSQVKAGENAGETLKHDHVVRLYQPVPAWPAGTAQRLSLTVNAGVPAHPRRVAFVLVDAATQKPIQAITLGC
jgi:hypothetical protein